MSGWSLQMIEDEKTEFIKTLVGLAAIKPGGNQLTKEAYEIWWAAMKDWALTDFKAAASHLASAVEFMPSPYHFRQLKRAAEKTSGEAWTIALKSCTCWRGGETPGGRIDRAVKAIGGYRAIAMADTETALPHIERRFKEAYEELSDVEETREALPQITLRELQNKVQGKRLGDAVRDLLPSN
jgi:hypothetical protein